MSSFCKYFQSPKTNRFEPHKNEAQLKSDPRQFFCQNQIKIQKVSLNIQISPMTTSRTKKSLKKLFSSPQKYQNFESSHNKEFPKKKNTEVVSQTKRLARSYSANGNLLKQLEIKANQIYKINASPNKNQFLYAPSNPFLKQKSSSRTSNAIPPMQNMRYADILLPYFNPVLDPIKKPINLNQIKATKNEEKSQISNKIHVKQVMIDQSKSVQLCESQIAESYPSIPNLSYSLSLAEEKLNLAKAKSLDIFAKRAQSEPTDSQISSFIVANSIMNDLGEKIDHRGNFGDQMIQESDIWNMEVFKPLEFSRKVSNGTFIRKLI